MSLICISCKRKRKINVEGLVTDVHTGLALPNIDVVINGASSANRGGGSTLGIQKTDANGHFIFKNVTISGLAWVVVEDPIYRDINAVSQAHSVTDNDLKFVGKTSLMRNIQMVCYSELNLTITAPISIQQATYTITSSGIDHLPSYMKEYKSGGTWSQQSQYNGPAYVIFGYSDAKNIVKTNYFDQNTQTNKTQYDTIVSQGCGSVNTYTINLN
ncbi:MAG: hypothetical protein K0S53_927 [Bacteroidetes bacterium]|jgi:hypothetical protein|nr:hypothetical protein [Bacteroidota bacterium]MDF2452901.1 hypothetical protein [Bacteroidota bacterium]